LTFLPAITPSEFDTLTDEVLIERIRAAISAGIGTPAASTGLPNCSAAAPNYTS
jgi:hypothetical protein